MSTYPKTCEHLKPVLATSYSLLIKTHNYHWNVVGSDFPQYHELLEEQYNELFEAVDMIAERIRALQSKAPGSMAEFSALSKIPEGNKDASATDMMADLLDSHEKVIELLKEGVTISGDEGDDGTQDMLIERLRAHDKTAWMLRSILGK